MLGVSSFCDQGLGALNGPVTWVACETTGTAVEAQFALQLRAEKEQCRVARTHQTQ